MNDVILIGFMGSGKSCVGKRLSYQMRKPLVDTDKEIETKQGKTIQEIFQTEGEAYFRELETKCLEHLLEEQAEHVISVGGGLPIKEENRKLLKKMGVVVYLRATAQTVWERLKEDRTRPLLQGDNPQGKIQELLEIRGPVYEQAADIMITTDGKSFSEIIAEIEEAYHEIISH